jgi:hypothetical protein
MRPPFFPNIARFSMSVVSSSEISRPPIQRKGFSYDRLIRYFFASNAGLTIVILLLIIEASLTSIPVLTLGASLTFDTLLRL